MRGEGRGRERDVGGIERHGCVCFGLFLHVRVR